MRSYTRPLVIASLLSIFILLFSSFSIRVDNTIADKKPSHTPRASATEKSQGNSDKKLTQQAERTETLEEDAEDEEKSTGKEKFRGSIISVNETGIEIIINDEDFLTLQVTEETKILIPGNNDAGVMDLPVDGLVDAQANLPETPDASGIATRITLIPGKPQPLHRVGIVTEYQPGKMITIENIKDGSQFTFFLTETAKLLPADRIEQLGAGTLVTVISPRDPSGGPVTASGIVIHPESRSEPTPTTTMTIDPDLTPSLTATLTLTPIP